MGQKVNPVSFRTGVMTGWKSRWYASKKEFSELLVEDQKLRRFVKDKYRFAGIPKIEIERTRDEVKVILYTARPGIIIGRKGQEVERLQEELQNLVGRRINPALRVTGVMVCLFEANTRLAQEVVNDIVGFLEKSRGHAVPWADARVFATRVRRNVKLAECPSHGKSIFAYAPGCPGAADYAALAAEVLGGVPSEMAAEYAATA